MNRLESENSLDALFADHDIDGPEIYVTLFGDELNLSDTQLQAAEMASVFRYFRHESIQAELEQNPSNRFQIIHGYVSPKTRSPIGYPPDDARETWFAVDITTATDDQEKEVFLPRTVIESLPESTIVRITARWCCIENEYYLIARRIDWLESMSGPPQSLRLAHIGRTARCRYCGRRLMGDEKWRLNSIRVPECVECSNFRDNRDPKEFERFCARLIRHRGRRRLIDRAD